MGGEGFGRCIEERGLNNCHDGLGFRLASRSTLKTGRAISPPPPRLIKVEILRAVKRPRSLAKSAIAYGSRFYGPLILPRK